MTIVGHVVFVQSQTTNCVYTIDDGTGRIEARHWIDSSSEEGTSKWKGIEYALLSLFLPDFLYVNIGQESTSGSLAV